MHSIYYLSAGSPPDLGLPDCSDDITCSRSTAVDGTGPSQPHQSCWKAQNQKPQHPAAELLQLMHTCTDIHF